MKALLKWNGMEWNVVVGGIWCQKQAPNLLKSLPLESFTAVSIKIFPERQREKENEEIEGLGVELWRAWAWARKPEPKILGSH